VPALWLGKSIGEYAESINLSGESKSGDVCGGGDDEDDDDVSAKGNKSSSKTS
jgi:hypothetical protein